MLRLPAICKACGAVSPSPLRASRPDEDVAFDVPSPCRACGASARVPADVLQRLRTALTAAARANLDSEDLERLAELLSGRQEADGDEAEPVERVDLVSRVADAAPALLPVARALPSGTRTELVAFLRLVGRALAVAGPGGEVDAVGALERALEVEFDEAGVRRPNGEEPDRELVRARERLETSGRNDPCPCGSGEKYKDCHWLEDRRRVRG